MEKEEQLYLEASMQALGYLDTLKRLKRLLKIHHFKAHIELYVHDSYCIFLPEHELLDLINFLSVVGYHHAEGEEP